MGEKGWATQKGGRIGFMRRGGIGEQKLERNPVAR